jgi:4a-hydroxytetrahydrobiopterin dehydratase
MDISHLRPEIEKLDGWSVSHDGTALSKAYAFSDFASALAFVNRVGALAEDADHHPDISLSWGKVAISLTTHSEGGITEKDLALARRIDEL